MDHSITSYVDSHEISRLYQTPEEVIQHYNDRTDYDTILTSDIYRGPQIVAECTEKYLKGKTDQVILDVAAGSGKVGLELTKLGYTNLHALDPAEVLFNNSSNKWLYRKYMTDLLREDTVLNVADDYYDAITVCGGFAVGLVPSAALFELIRIVRPGGLIINIMREEHLIRGAVHEAMEGFMKELEEMGKWKLLERTVVSKYVIDCTGVVFVFEVTESGCVRYKSAVLN